MQGISRSASPGNRHNGSDPNAARSIPITVDHSNDQRAKQRDDRERTKADTEPLPTHSERHIPFGIASNTEINGREMRHQDVFVRAPKWIEYARRYGPPTKLDEHLAAMAGRDGRTARRWLSGEVEPPMVILGWLAQEALKEIFGR